MPPTRAGTTSYTLHAAAVAALAAIGCTTTTNIVPDQLPVVTEAAAKNPKLAVEVLSPDVSSIRLDGRLDAVSISMVGWEKAHDRFEAPITARLSGPWLIVQDQEKGRVYALSQVTSVRVQRYDASGAIAGGTALTAIGAVMAAAGTVLIGVSVPLRSAASLIFGPQMIGLGIGLGAGGIPLIVAGKRVNERMPPGVPPAPPRVALHAGPGGIALRF